jgi:enoyl-CoA hydratase/carnithine racemase
MTAPVTIGPELLAPIGDWVPAEAATEGASIVLIEGDVDVTPPARQFLERVVALTIGLGPSDIGCDLWSPDRADVEGWLASATAHPQATVAAALLMRRPLVDVWDGLIAESSTYSVLQSGPEFNDWLHSGRRPAITTDHSTRATSQPIESSDAVEVVLTRPGRHNALDVQMREELLPILDGLRMQPPRTIVVRGEGASFCSGGDLSEFGTFSDPASAHQVRLQRSLARRFAQLGPRMVVGLHGACLGAGIELAAFAGQVVAAGDASIGLPEGALGLIPGAGGTVSVRRRIGARRTLELIVSGKRLDGTTAWQWGLVDEVVAPSELSQRLHQLAGSSANGVSSAD